MTDSFWDLDDAANADIPEPPKQTFSDLPDKAWVLVKNATTEQKEGAWPKVEPVAGKDGRPDWYKFKTAFIVVGGGDKIKPSHAGKYLFWEASTHRNEEKDSPNMPVGGALYNMILDTLAPEDGPASVRWPKARAVLAAAVKGKTFEHNDKEYTYEPASFNGDTQMLYAVCFREALKAKAYTVVGQTYTPKQKQGSTFVPKQTIGSINAATEDVMREHGIIKVDDENNDNF